MQIHPSPHPDGGRDPTTFPSSDHRNEIRSRRSSLRSEWIGHWEKIQPISPQALSSGDLPWRGSPNRRPPSGPDGSGVVFQFTQLHSDLYFSVRLAGRDARIHLLVEHQSTPQPDMPLRMLEYIAAALRHELDRTGGKGPLPVVIPFVLNQGPERWNQPVSLLEYYDIPAELEEWLRPYLPAFRLHLHDLAASDPAEEERDAALRIVLQEMKMLRDAGGLRFLVWLSDQPVPEAIFALLEWVARYLLSVDEGLDIVRIREILEPNPRLREGIMTLADKLFNEGLEEGIQKGIQKGEWIGRIRMLFEFLGRETHSREKLEQMEAEELNALHERLQAEYNRRFKNG